MRFRVLSLANRIESHVWHQKPTSKGNGVENPTVKISVISDTLPLPRTYEAVTDGRPEAPLEESRPLNVNDGPMPLESIKQHSGRIPWM